MDWHLLVTGKGTAIEIPVVVLDGNVFATAFDEFWTKKEQLDVVKEQKREERYNNFIQLGQYNVSIEAS